MAIPTLNTYEYQYTDSGVLLNGNSTTLPFYDITNVRGLDLPQVSEVTNEYDNQHGGYVDARFVGLRTIILEGNMYCNPATADAVIDQLVENFLPRENDEPFYYKGAGIGQRYIMCKPIGINYDLDAARSYGMTKVQIQLRAGDPIKYTDNVDIVVTAGNDTVLANSGKIETFPVFEISGAYSELSFVKNSTGEVVTVSYLADADDTTVVDFKSRQLFINDVRASAYITSLGWWNLEPGNTTFRVISTSANLMVNADAEATFSAGFTVGSRWTATQNYTGQKHAGTKSLRFVRNSKTAGNGSVTIPTGVTNLPAGKYSAWVWVKGTLSPFNFSVLNNGVAVATITGAKNDSVKWKKLQVTFDLAATSGAITFNLNDNGTTKPIKGKVLYVDDMGVVGINAAGAMVITAESKNGWL